MKQIALLSTLSIALLASFGAQAADTTELKVTGTIKPGACVPAFTGGGTVNYGVIAANTLVKGDYTKLGRKEIAFGITCDAPAKMSMKIIDSKQASALSVATGLGAQRTLGLGTIDGKNIGGYSVFFTPSKTTGDGAAVASLFKEGTANWSSYVGDTAMRLDHQYSWAASGTIVPAAYKVISGTFSVEASLNKPEELPLTKEITLDGAATIEVTYL